MSLPVSERPFLGAPRDVRDLLNALYSILGEHAVRSNQAIPKDGSELITMTALDHKNQALDDAINNDVDFGVTSVVRFTTDANNDLTGIAGGTANDPGGGQNLRLINVGSNNLILRDEDVLSAAENRMLLGGDKTLNPNEAIGLWYDNESLRWRVKQNDHPDRRARRRADLLLIAGRPGILQACLHG